MSSAPQTRQIQLITQGTVIDHIPAGVGQKIFQLIGNSDDVIVIGLNLESNKHGKKDILKYANKDLGDRDLSLIAILSPDATVSIIRDKQVNKKVKPQKPDMITNLLACPNPQCITNKEPVITKFWTDPVFRCFFCERLLRHEDIAYVRE